MNKAEKLAYFFESRDLSSVFRDWPAEIGLVLCMDDDGGCEMLLHHVAEGRTVIRKVASVLNRPLGQFAVVPPVEGHPTRRVLFSDEQKLLALVAAETDLPEMAQDYLLNFRYENERRRQRGEPGGTARAAPSSRRSSASTPRSRYRYDPVKDIKPRLHLSEISPKEHPAAAGDIYYRAGDLKGDECRFGEAIISIGSRGVRLTISPDYVMDDTPAIRVMDVAFRDDFSRFRLPPEVGRIWMAGDPLIIDMPVEAFPSGLQQRFALASRMADITVTRHGMFVTPGAQVPRRPAPQFQPIPQIQRQPEPEPEVQILDPMPAPAMRQIPQRRAMLTPFRLALVALTGVGLMTGSVMRAVELPEMPSAYVQVLRAVE